MITAGVVAGFTRQGFGMMPSMRKRDFRVLVWVRVLLALLLLTGLSGCDNKLQKAAPIGDHAILEQLATAYRSVTQQYPVQPASMPPVGKKEFVQRVFATAGYDYLATLKAFAKQGVDVTSQDQRDLAELLSIPHKGLADTELATLYSAEELAAILVIQAGLK